MENNFSGIERRKFTRLDFVSPFAFKVCSKETISKLLKGYIANISESGIFCTISQKVNMDDILWLSFDRATLGICESLEKNSLIYQGGIIGKVVRVESKDDGSYDTGLQFLTREEERPAHVFWNEKT
ncbi:MAG: PilZ domain-containing protein [Candidatus Omnitrophota bacterium]